LYSESVNKSNSFEAHVTFILCGLVYDTSLFSHQYLSNYDLRHFHFSFKETIWIRLNLLQTLADRGPALPGKRKDFSLLIYLGFRDWGTSELVGGVGTIKLVLRTFPESVWRSAQNLVEIGAVVRTWKRDKGRHKHSVLYILM